MNESEKAGFFFGVVITLIGVFIGAFIGIHYNKEERQYFQLNWRCGDDNGSILVTTDTNINCNF